MEVSNAMLTILLAFGHCGKTFRELWGAHLTYQPASRMTEAFGYW